MSKNTLYLGHSTLQFNVLRNVKEQYGQSNRKYCPSLNYFFFFITNHIKPFIINYIEEYFQNFIKNNQYSFIKLL